MMGAQESATRNMAGLVQKSAAAASVPVALSPAHHPSPPSPCEGARDDGPGTGRRRELFPREPTGQFPFPRLTRDRPQPSPYTPAAEDLEQHGIRRFPWSLALPRCSSGGVEGFSDAPRQIRRPAAPGPSGGAEKIFTKADVGRLDLTLRDVPLLPEFALLDRPAVGYV